MELHHNRTNNDPGRRRDLEMTIERVSKGRIERQEQVDDLRDRVEARRQRAADSLDLSSTARLISEGEGESRADLVDSLRAAYENGNLNTRERIERAAHNLLAGQ